MNKNIIYLNKFIDTHVNTEIDINIIKNYLSLYVNRDYINDYDFFNSVDLSNIHQFKTKVDYNFNYRNYINFDIADNSQTIVFLNGNFLLADNLDKNIVLSNEFEKNDFSFNDKYIFDNLNIYFILNTLFYNSVCSLYVKDSYFNTNSVYVLNFFDDNFSGHINFPRSIFKIGKNVNINILEGYFNLSEKVIVNSNTYLLAESGSEINFNFLNESIKTELRAHSFYAKLLSYSNLLYNDFSFGNKIFKNNNYIFLLGNFCKFKSNFGRFLKTKSKDNMNLKIFHLGHNSFSRSIFKSVVSNFASCDFNGLIDVDFDVLNVDSGLICKSLLLNESAQSKLIPELAIKNNEVKCFHGATVGFLDDDAIFYLMSRGFSKIECESLLVNAFLFDLIDNKNLFLINLVNGLFEKYYVC